MSVLILLQIPRSRIAHWHPGLHHFVYFLLSLSFTFILLTAQRRFYVLLSTTTSIDSNILMLVPYALCLKKFNQHPRRSRKLHWKQTLLRHASAYADSVFQSWHYDFDQSGPSSSKGPSWFRRHFWETGPKIDWNGNQRSQQRGGGRRLHFCEDDEVENIFQYGLGGGQFFYWSFVNSNEEHRWRSSSHSHYSNSYRTSYNYRYQSEEEYDSSSASELASHRLALGLKSYGPLKLEDVKSAYRACALKWHPDRHQGSSKAIAEERFKLCSIAYQSICAKLAVAD